MTKTLIGLDYAGAACVKITTGTNDPVTTLDTDISKFLFNSKWAADVKVHAVFVPVLNTTAGPVYLPSSGAWTYWHLYANSIQEEIYKKSHFGSVLYDFPLFEIKLLINGRYNQARMWQDRLGYNDTTTQWLQRRAWTYGWLDAGATYLYSNNTIAPGETNVASRSGLNPILIFRLPGDNTAIQNGTPQAPVGGQPAISIGPTALKVAKPGFNVNTATGTQLAFDSSNIPAKVIAAADLAIPAGASSYDTGITLPTNTAIDLHFYQTGQDTYYPAPPLFSNFGAEYWVDGSLIRFNNPNAACRARMLVIAQDNTPPTSGANDVLREFTSGGQNVVQFLRPGAGASPNFADIVVDSRWPAIQIVKEGYISVASGVQTYPITYDASGMFVFIKYCTVHGSGSVQYRASWTKAVRQPIANFWSIRRNAVESDRVAAGDCTYVKYNNAGATFYTHRDQPLYAYYDTFADYDNDNKRYVYEAGRIVGLRYYVFGVAIP